MRTNLLGMKKAEEFSWWENNKEITIANWEALCYTLGMSLLNFNVIKKLSLDEKTKSNLRLMKGKMLLLIIKSY